MHNQRIALIATGGTIASLANASGEYNSGSLSIDSVIPSELLNNLDVINLFNIDSCDMTSAKLLRLATKIKELSDDCRYRAMIVTHGTDSMVESALFIYLTYKTTKPVIFTGAMRSANAKDFDGIDNFNLALKSCNHSGVFIAMGGKLLCASQAIKTDCNSLESFKTKPSPIVVQGLFEIPKKLPKASILHSHAGDSYVNPYADIIIYAGLGNGSVPHITKKKLCALAQRGKIIVRSSICTYGYVSRHTQDEQCGFIASGYFNPLQSKIVSMLAYQNTRDTFDRYAHSLALS